MRIGKYDSDAAVAGVAAGLRGQSNSAGDAGLRLQRLHELEKLVQNRELSMDKLRVIAERSPLGRVLSAGLVPFVISREEMKARIEDAGRHVAHELECCLPTLGTIAMISPLLGLLGTVVGMILTFEVLTTQGIAKPNELAGGISTALITTAAGLIVALPALWVAVGTGMRKLTPSKSSRRNAAVPNRSSKPSYERLCCGVQPVSAMAASRGHVL